MINASHIAKVFAAAILLIAVCTAPALAQTVKLAYALVSGKTSEPAGYAQFCQTRPSECAPKGALVGEVVLNQAKWSELLRVNSFYNQSIVPVSDQDLYQTEEFWTYPNGYGDCEDFALAKRRELIDRGWPASTLLLSVVRQTNGEGHAILMVRTDRGDLVLDNQDSAVKLWTDTSYTFLKRQSQANPAAWVALTNNRTVVSTASYR
jgi:predicted transglutaminase-like cysteine proteinase